MSKKTVRIGLGAVSYTHLDVYKRQIFKEILLKVNLREFKEPVKDMRQKMKEIAALPEDTYELKYRRRVRKIAYHWHLYYLTHFLFKKGGDS